MRYRLDPDLIRRADEAAIAVGDRPLTVKQIAVLEFYDGRNYGYRSVALQFGISKDTARDHVSAGLRKLERVLGP